MRVWLLAIFLGGVTSVVGETPIPQKKMRRVAQKAVAYAMKNERALTAQDVATLVDLNRRFHLGLDSKKLASLRANLKPKRITPLWRFADETYVASESEVKGMKGNDRITASALYCDKYALPWDFSQELERMAQGSDYNPTRALLAIGLLKKQNCRFDTSRVEALLPNLRRRVVQLAAEESSPDALRCEAILYLVLLGYRQDVRRDSVERLLALQAQDGSFGRSIYTTLLAARTLLEYSH